MDRNLLTEAEEFVRSCYQELKKSEQETLERIKQIQSEVEVKGLYTHTYEELEYGAKVAWRNSNRCTGRLFWDSLTVKDRRDVQTEEQLFTSLLEHIEYATNGGKIRSTITIFPPMSGQQKIRIWNHQLIRYAGYETEQGIIGDSDSLVFTKACIELGWEPKYGRFDLLPIVIQINEEPAKLFEIPEELVLEVPIQHPHYEWFKDLHLKWYAVPIISSMSLEIGGVTYTAAPFNGWYMGTEIGARNLADETRYNMLPQIGGLMGLDIKSNSSLWKDRALLELNTAVLFSYKEAGVSIVDHHTAAQQFRRFEEREADAGRQVTGNWAWLIPPMSPAATHIYHKPYKNDIKKPNYFYQKNPF